MPELVVAINARRAKSGAAEFNVSVDGMGRRADRAGRQVSRLERRTDRMGRSARRASGPIAGLVAGLSGLLIARDVTRTVADFETTMLTLQGVTTRAGESIATVEERMSALESTARNLGAVTQFSATQAGEGLLFLARAGFEADEAIEALPDTLNLAAAGAVELGFAADLASNVLSAFGKESTTITKVVDALTNTANSANTDVRQLGEALKFVAPVSGALGRSVEETSAALGVLGDSGIQASQAGTNLRGIFAALLGPTDKGKEAIRNLGLSIGELDPETNSITEIFERFQERGLSAADAVDIFGRRNAAAALVLTDSADRIGELTRLTIENEGVTRRNAELIGGSLTNAFKEVRSAVEEAFLRIGDSGFAGSLKSVLRNVAEAIRILSGFETTLDSSNVVAQRLAITLKGLFVILIAVVSLKLAGFGVGAVLAFGKIAVGATKLSASMGILLGVLIAFVGFKFGSSIANNFRPLSEVLVILEGDIAKFMLQFDNFAQSLKEFGTGRSLVDIVDRLFTSGQSLPEAIAETEKRLASEEASLFRLVGGPNRKLLEEVESLRAKMQELVRERNTIELQINRDPIDRQIRDIQKRLEELDSEPRFLEATSIGFPTTDIAAQNARANIFELTEKLKELRELQDAGNKTASKLSILAKVDTAELDAVDQIVADKLRNIRSRFEGEADRNAANIAASVASLAEGFTGGLLGFQSEVIAKFTPSRGEFDSQGFIADLLDFDGLSKASAKFGEVLLSSFDSIFGVIKDKVVEGAEDVGNTAADEVTKRLTAAQAAADAFIASARAGGDGDGDGSQRREKNLIRFLDSIVQETEALGASNSELLIRNGLLEAQDAIISDKVIPGTEQFTQLIGLAREKLEELAESQALQEVADQIGDTIGQAFVDLIQNVEDFEAIAKRAFEEISRILLSATVGRLISTAVSGGFAGIPGAGAFFSEKGNVFHQSMPVKAFAGGGVFDRPVSFALASGQPAVFAERGPEAIMPVKRMTSGELGVVASGGGGTTNIRMTVVTQDADSFRRSERQITRRLRRKLTS